MTKLHFNYKDIFRALRLGFSAKKVWMMFLGLLFSFAGYAKFGYLAHITAGHDFITVWESSRLLPFPDPHYASFPWYSWLIFALGVVWFAACSLLTGAAVSKVTYEQLRGDEFYESREAFRFAFRHWSSILASPMLLVVFIVGIGVAGLALSALGAIPYFGDIFVGAMALPALAASFFILYLAVVLLASLLIGPSVVGATRNDTFDTIFEVFSSVNEQPARLLLYVTTAAGLSKLGAFLFSLATAAAGRIGYAIVRVFTGPDLADTMANATFYFRISPPAWCPEPARAAFELWINVLGLPQAYLGADYVPLGNWGADVGALLLGTAFYLVALVVLAYGCSVWYAANTLGYIVITYKKDEKNLLEIPDEEEMLEPVVTPAECGAKEEVVAPKQD